MLLLTIAVIIILTAALTVVLIHQARKEREQVKKPVVEQLLNLVSRNEIGAIDLRRLSQTVGLSTNETKDVAFRVYTVCYRSAFNNPKLKERLREIALRLHLNAGDCDYAEAPNRAERYSNAWAALAGEGLPTHGDLKSLLALQSELGLTARSISRLFGSRAITLYRSAYRQYLPEIDSEYLTDLRQYLIGREIGPQDRDRLAKLLSRLDLHPLDLSTRWQQMHRLESAEHAARCWLYRNAYR